MNSETNSPPNQRLRKAGKNPERSGINWTGEINVSDWFAVALTSRPSAQAETGKTKEEKRRKANKTCGK